MSNTVADDRDANRREDQALVEAARAGDATAFRDLVEKYQNRIYYLIYGMLRNREDARELTQEAFVSAYRRLDGFRLEASFHSWLCRIATNRAIDHTRASRRREDAGLDDRAAIRADNGELADVHHEDSPSRHLERRQLYEQIMNAIEDLSPEHRQVVLLRELEGLSYREISEISGVPQGTVMSRLFYARKKLQTLLREAGVDAPGSGS